MFRPILTDYELQKLQRKYRSLKRKQEQKGIGKFPKLDAEITRLYWEIEEAEAIRNGTYSRFEAEKAVYHFINKTPDKQLFDYLKENGLTTHRLIDEVEKNPDFIKETYQPTMKWLPIVRIEEDIAYVRTIRGIEPCHMANNFCRDAEVGQYALCKSVEQTLFMHDHSSKQEVET